MNLLIPNNSRPVATPTNSEMTSPRLQATSAAMSRKVMHSPYSSRTNSLRPLPVTTPVRAAIPGQKPGRLPWGPWSEKGISESGSGGGIGVDAAGIVIYMGGNEYPPKDRQDEQDPSCPVSAPWHASHLSVGNVDIMCRVIITRTEGGSQRLDTLKILRHLLD